jgi:hypothetical protein
MLWIISGDPGISVTVTGNTSIAMWSSSSREITNIGKHPIFVSGNLNRGQAAVNFYLIQP